MIHAVILDKCENSSYWNELSGEKLKITLCSQINAIPHCDVVIIAEDCLDMELSVILEQVRNRQGLKCVPTAAVTNDHSAAKQEMLINCGFDDVLRMPLCKSLLIRRIEALAAILPYNLSAESFSFDSLIDIYDDGKNGAYSVPSGDFAAIYRFVLRILQRLEKSAQVLLLTVSSNIEVPDDKQLAVMNTLSTAVRRCLRRGDMASVCGKKQVVVLLLGADDDGGHLVANRIVSSFYSNCLDPAFILDYDIHEVHTIKKD